MPEQDKHDKARELAEAALEKYADGDQQQGDKLADQATKIDRGAVEEIVAELDEDAEANHDPEAIAKG